MESEKEWFQSGSQVGKSPEIIEKEHEAFKKRALVSLGIKKQALSLASSKEDLDRRISELLSGKPTSEATQELDIATKAHDGYEKDRQNGGKKIAKDIQSRLNAFSQFLSAYAGIADAVSSAGGPYSQVGFQTLSILLVVVVNKTKNDTRIVENLVQIRKSLPRLDIWPQIYPNDIMRELVASAYLQVIAFSRAAVEYFSKFWYRMYLAINPVASVAFEDIAAGLHQTLAEINSQAMIGLHDNAWEIKQRVLWLQEAAERAETDRKRLLVANEEATKERQKLLDQNQELRKQFERQVRAAELREKQEDMNMLSAFQKRLKVDDELEGTDISAVRNVLMDVFPNHGHYSPALPYTGYLQFHERFLKDMLEYQRWMEHSQSSLFFLSGSTAIEGRKLKGFSHCWLSPAAIYITDSLRRQGCKVGFYSCHAGLGSSHPPGELVLSSFIFQVLQWRPQILRTKEYDFNEMLESSHHVGREHMLVNLLSDILLEMQDLQTVYLVIDRLDCCDTRIDIVANELARLITIHTSTAFRVKVAIVAETSGGSGNWNAEFLPEHEYATDRLCVVKGWNQRRLTPGETSMPRRPSIWSSPSAATV